MGVKGKIQKRYGENKYKICAMCTGRVECSRFRLYYKTFFSRHKITEYQKCNTLIVKYAEFHVELSLFGARYHYLQPFQCFSVLKRGLEGKRRIRVVFK